MTADAMQPPRGDLSDPKGGNGLQIASAGRSAIGKISREVWGGRGSATNRLRNVHFHVVHVGIVSRVENATQAATTRT